MGGRNIEIQQTKKTLDKILSSNNPLNVGVSEPFRKGYKIFVIWYI